nr:serine protease inhibitor Kazal-type 1-like [Anolis sagrei ordinatus]
MKVTCIFLLFAVGIFCYSANAEIGASDEKEPVCERYHPPACPRIYDPICGTDGVTYGNECILCNENRKRNLHIRIKKSGTC